MTDRRIVKPDGLDLDSPGRRDYWVAFTHDSIWGDHLVPLTVFVGPNAEAGRGLVAFGANHGNEYEGPIALKRLISEIDPAAVSGRIILIPVLNPSAFRSGTRESVADDGVNMNRAFVADAGRSPTLAGITHRIAAFVREHVWPRVHVVIDLHAGGEVAKFIPCVGWFADQAPETSAASLEVARWFGASLVLESLKPPPSFLIGDAALAGKITVGGEFGWGCSTLPEGIAMARHGVLAAAIHHGQLRGGIERHAHHLRQDQRLVTIGDPACTVIAPFDGHLEILRDCGERVRRGDRLGVLHDFRRIDLPGEDIVAATDGVVVARAWAAPVRQGQHIAVVGRLLD